MPPPDVSSAPSTPAPDGSVPRRLRHAAVCAVLVALAFNCSAGRDAADTKIDLTVDPGGFLSRALHLWEPLGFSGQVQNQAYGYLFPIGPFFALGHAAGLPGWVVQRLWWSLVLVVAYTGVVALAGRLRIGTPFSQGLAGAAFATSPHLLSVLGPVSAEAWPMALAAWAIVPLVPDGRGRSARRAAMLSGVAALLMGGANATLTLAALVPAVLYLVAGTGIRQRLRLAAWWVLAVVLASLWWVGPLLLLGRYSPPFLDYIESAGVTTSVTSMVEATRGTSDWVAYLPSSGWRAGYQLLSVPSVVLMSCVVVALGLAGLAHRAMPQRRWVVVSLLFGVVTVTAGHRAGVEGIAAGSVRSLLDGALAPLRNVHKFDVVLRLPLALGLAHVVGRCRLPRRSDLADVARAGSRGYTALVSSAVIVFVACCAVGATAAPLLTLRLARDHTYPALPGYWSQVATWLGHHDARGRALIVPASHDQQYLWGVPTDNPLQPLASTPWTERNGVPLVPTGGIRMLDAIGSRLESGTPSPGLAATLRAIGIDYVVVRNDLDPGNPDNARPVLVQRALAASSGIVAAASFGPLIRADEDFGPVDENLRRPVAAVTVWRVGPPAQDTRVHALPLSDVGVVAGGPESVLDLADAGQAPGATVLAGDATRTALAAGTTVLTDGLRRRAVDVGAVVGNRSATLAPGDLTGADRALTGYRMFDGRDDATARVIGLRSVSASSSASDPTSAPAADPSRQPYAAVDGDPATSWQPSPGVAPAGQWLQLRLASPRRLDTVTLTAAAGSPALGLAVTTDTGTVPATLPARGTVRLVLPPGRTATVRVTITAVSGGAAAFADVGIAGIALPGVQVARTIVVPDTLPRGRSVDTIAFAAAAGDRSGCVVYDRRPLCAAALYRQGEDDAGLDRTYTLPSGGEYAVQADVVPRPGPALDAALVSAAGPGLRATASSQAVADPRAGPSAAVDGARGTGWVASPDDRHPTLTLSWTGKRTITNLRLVLDPLLAGTAPTAVRVISADGTRTALVSPTGLARFPALHTDRIRIVLATTTGLRVSLGPQSGRTRRLGLGVSEVTVPGVSPTPRPARDARPVVLRCGDLPSVVVAGHRVELQATTTVGDLLSGAPIAAQPCTSSPVALPARTQRLQARSTAAWRVQTIVLRSTSAPPSTGGDVATSVVHWDTTYRSVHVAARSQASLLTVSENANPGWAATLDGHELRAVTVDGFLQGYLLPPGAAGTVHLEYRPDHTYRGALLVGGVAAFALVVLALVGRRRRPQYDAGTVHQGAGGWVPAVVGLLALSIAGGVGGAVAVVVSGCAVLMVRRGLARSAAAADAVPALLAAAGFVIAGIALASGPWGGADYLAGRDGMQVLCLSALALVSTSGLGARADARGAATASPVVPPPDTPAPPPRSSRPS